MFTPSHFLHFVLLLIFPFDVILSLHLPPIQLIDNPLPSNLTLPLNASSTTNLSATRIPTFRCPGGPEYGNRIRRESCEDAANSMLTNLYFGSKRILEFKERNVFGGVTFTDVVLPYLSLSCK